MKIQIADISDLKAINLIRKAIADDETSGHKLSDIGDMEIISNDKQATFIAKVKDEIVGYISLHENNVLNNNYDAIFEIFVHPDFQRKGIGKELYLYSEKFFKEEMPFNRLILGVLSNNEGAIRLYNRVFRKTNTWT